MAWIVVHWSLSLDDISDNEQFQNYYLGGTWNGKHHPLQQWAMETITEVSVSLCSVSLARFVLIYTGQGFKKKLLQSPFKHDY